MEKYILIKKNQEIIYEGLNIYKGYASERKDLIYCEKKQHTDRVTQTGPDFALVWMGSILV